MLSLIRITIVREKHPGNSFFFSKLGNYVFSQGNLERIRKVEKSQGIKKLVATTLKIKEKNR